MLAALSEHLQHFQFSSGGGGLRDLLFTRCVCI